MSTKYKFYDPNGTYFVTYAVVGWFDVFTRDEYCTILIDSFNYCNCTPYRTFLGYSYSYSFGGIRKKGASPSGEAGGGIIYKEGTYSFSDFNLQFLLAEGKGLLGGWSRVRGSAKVYRGKDGVYYVNVSAEGFTPSGTQGSVTFSGNVEVYSGGNLVGTQSLNKLKGASIIQSGWQNVGQGTFALPSYGSDVYLRFNIGYTYSEGAGYVSPWPAQGHSKLYIPYFVIDAWTY